MKHTQEELLAIVAPIQAERAVQAHINSVVRYIGYDDENSIAKYLVVGNAFYGECKKISLWIGSVWVATHNSTAATVEELIASLPAYE